MCDTGYKFADCSKKVEIMDDNLVKDWDLSIEGPGWFTMQYSGNKTTSLSISPNVTSEIYISKGADSDPNNFVYDMKISNVTSNITITADKLGLTDDHTYSVAVYANAIDEAENKVIKGSVGVYVKEEKDNAAQALSLVASFMAVCLSFLA